jgi:hypothetical protein
MDHDALDSNTIGIGVGGIHRFGPTDCELERIFWGEYVIEQKVFSISCCSSCSYSQSTERCAI